MTSAMFMERTHALSEGLGFERVPAGTGTCPVRTWCWGCSGSLKVADVIIAETGADMSRYETKLNSLGFDVTITPATAA